MQNVMSMQTLIIDSGDQAIRRAPWRRVMMMLVERAAEVVESYPDRYIHTPNPIHFSRRCPICQGGAEKHKCNTCSQTGFVGEPSHYLPTCERVDEDRWRVRVPSVIRLVMPIPHKPVIKFSRQNIYARDRGQCQYCGHKVSWKVFQFEHVVPRAQGGKTGWTNIVVSCGDCNLRKGSRTPEQAGMTLRSKPVRPKSLPTMNRPRVEYKPGMHESWLKYVDRSLRDAAYWQAELENDE